MTGRCVIKIGGSLLTRPDLAIRIREVLNNEYANQQVNLVIGGGKIIDALRELDSVHVLFPIEMHWRCVRALRLTYEIAGDLFPDAHRIECPEAFQAHRTSQTHGIYLIAVDSFYSLSDGDILPRDWTTTTDSIAAMLAHKLSINRLTLIKPCSTAETMTIAEAVTAGIVDVAMPTIARGLQIKLQSL